MKEPGYCRSNFLGLIHISSMARPVPRCGPPARRKIGALAGAVRGEPMLFKMET